MTAVLAAGEGGTRGGALLVGICFVLFVLTRLASRAGAPGHGHGDRAHVARHEAAHAVAAREVGGRVLSARVDEGWLSGPYGRVQWDMSARPLRAEVESNVAFLAAGRLAAPGTGCSGDMAEIGRQLRRLPPGDRAAVRAAGERRARQIVSSRRSEIDRVAAVLDQRGQL